MKIGDVTLDNDLIWADEFKFTLGAGVAERTIYGGMIVQTYSKIGGRPMTLEGSADRGWQSRSTVLALQALAEFPGMVYTVELPDLRTFQVMFRNEEEPVLEFDQVTPASAPGGDFWYYGTVKLRIV